MANTPNYNWPRVIDSEALEAGHAVLDSFFTAVDFQIATNAAAIATKAPKSNPVFTGAVKLPSTTNDDDSDKAARTDFVQYHVKQLRDNPQGAAVWIETAGDLTNGDVVTLRSDGKVEAVTGTVQAFEASDDISVFPANWRDPCAAIDPLSGKIVAVGRYDHPMQTTDEGIKIRVGTVSGDTITFGDWFDVIVDSYCENIRIVAMGSTGKFLIAYRASGASDYGRCVVVTLTGDAITVGAPVNFRTAYAWPAGLIFHEASGKAILLYKDTSFKACVVTVTGTTPTFGAAVDIDTGGTAAYIGKLANGKLVAARTYTSTKGFALLTVSGTALSVGTWLSATEVGAIVPLTESRFYSGGAIYTVGTTTVSLVGSATSPALSFSEALFSPIRKRIVICEIQISTNYLRVQTGRVSSEADAITWDPVVTVRSENTWRPTSILNSNGDAYVFFDNESGSSSMKILTLPFVATNYEHWIGVVDGDFTDGQPAKIQMPGSVDDAQSGLTAGTFYWLTPDGHLSSVKASYEGGYEDLPFGRAISPTKVLIEGREP